MSKTLHGLSEQALASHQLRQVGNTCTMHAIATGLRLLLNIEINPMELSTEIDRQWWQGHLMRVFPGWAVTPRMQVRIVHYLAKTRGVPVTASYHRGTIDILTDLLSIPDFVTIITMTWLRGQAPPIYFGNENRNHNISRSSGGHSMLLAAYDPAHHSGSQLNTPWGFINPWTENSYHLFWMADTDFRKAWRFWLPFNGPNPLVLIRRITEYSL